MLYRILIKLTINSFEQKCTNIFFNKLVTEIFVETQVCKVSTALSIVLKILGISKHICHEVNGISARNFWIAVENLGNVSQTSSCVKRCLRVLCHLTKIDNCINNISLYAMILDFVRVLSLIQ